MKQSLFIMPTKDKPRRYSMFPKTLSSVVEPITRPVLKAQGLAGSRILTEWPSVVGSALARHTAPEKLTFPPGKKTGGTLVISCENGFATELQHQQPLILDRLAGYFGYQAVARIVISHTYVKAVPPPPKKTVAAPGLDKESRALAEGVEDEELRAALLSLADTLSGKKPS